MSKNSIKLKWCKIRLGKDLNWWVNETSDKVNWDLEGLSILDPRQSSNLLETLETIKDFGLDNTILEKAFIAFAIDSKTDEDVKIVRTKDSIYDADDQALFYLPNNIDDEASEYAEFLDHITAIQVKMLNKTFKFQEDLEIDDLEDEIRQKYTNDYMEGKAIHAFTEIMDILEYVPEGYSLEDDLDDVRIKSNDDDEEDYSDEIEDFQETEEDLEEDDTMQWDDDDEEENYDFTQEDLDDLEDDDEEK